MQICVIKLCLTEKHYNCLLGVHNLLIPRIGGVKLVLMEISR